MTPLSMAKIGEAGYIRKIAGQDRVRLRLAEIGFVAGECVKVVAEMDGSMILNVKGTRVALNKAMAGRIFVCGI